jgi:hypothetical protein
MSEPSTPPAAEAPGSRERASYANPGMRISDAERAEVADRLSRHYGDGRLDQAEFSRRLDQAMNAVTQSDLSGLFDDLPEPGSGTAAPGTGPRDAGPAAAPLSGQRRPRPPCAGRPRRSLHRVISLGIFVVIAIVGGHALAHLFVPWVLIAVGAVLWLRYDSRRRRRGSSAEW